MTKTYAQLTREIQALQASAEKLRAAEVKAVIAKLNESIAEYGLTASDLHFPVSASASARRQTSSSSSSSRAGASVAKYGDGQGNTWGGRGPRPAWLRSAIAGGRSLESFEVSDGAASSASGGRSSTNATPGSRIKLPPLYGHPKTGQTWSGRGPKPAWLKQGLKKRGASIDDFLISSHASATSEPTTTEASAKPAATAPVSGAKARATAGDGRSAPASRKATPQKTGTQPKSGSAPAADGSGKTAPVAATRKNKDVRAASSPAPSEPTAAPARKTATKAPAKTAAKPPVKAAAKSAAKPATRKASAPRKNLPASMAPPADAAPTPSTVPTAAPMPAPQSDSVEGRGDATGR
jgi:DNA-binding protein H-NS